MSKGVFAGALILSASVAGLAHGSDVDNVRGGRIGYVMTTLHFATYQTAGAKECPNGFNEGPREQFKALFPDGKRKYTLMETQIAREAETWNPEADGDHGFKYYEPQTKIGLGLNLDGKIGPNDFTTPDGEQGIDNQFYRVLGCSRGYRDGQTANDFFDNQVIAKYPYNHSMFEISGVDSLANDDDVEVTWYRGLDQLMTDATGMNVIAGGSERIDTRWGKRYITKTRGKIIDGVLYTEPTDIAFPWSSFSLPTDELVRGMRFKLKLTPTSASGLMGGYLDYETWYNQLARSNSTHHLSYGDLSAPSFYKAMRRLADGYPDPKTGENTAISSALRATFTQVYILHPEQNVAADTATPSAVRAFSQAALVTDHQETESAHGSKR